MAIFFNRRLHELGIPHVLVPIEYKQEEPENDYTEYNKWCKAQKRRCPAPPREEAVKGPRKTYPKRKKYTPDLRKCRPKTFVPHYNAEVHHRFYEKWKQNPEWVAKKKQLYEDTKEKYREQRVAASRRWYEEKRKDPEWLKRKAEKQREEYRLKHNL